MHEFIAKQQDQITGTLCGFDRLVFRGTLRSIAHAEGMRGYLRANQVLLKDFGAHVEKVSRRLKEASLAEAEAARWTWPVWSMCGRTTAFPGSPAGPRRSG